MRITLLVSICLLLLAGTSLKAIGWQNAVQLSVTTDRAVKLNTDSMPYSTFYFYRSYIPKYNAPLKKVPIYINDSLITELKANKGVIYRVFKEGRVRVSIDSKGESELLVKAKFGKGYFFKCEVVKGLWFGKPTIEAVTEKVGREESGILEKN
jgi:hypothetical protein